MQSTILLLRAARPSLQWAEARAPRLPGLSRVLSGIQSFLAMFETCRMPMPVPVPVRRRPRLHSLALGLSAVLMAAAVAPLTSHAAVQSDRGVRTTGFETTADGQLVDVQVLVQGNAAPLYVAPGRWDKRYFQAFQGRNYSLAIRNNTGRRVGVLIAVDGLNVVNGERSGLTSGEAMYVLDPYERAVINGWRTSLQNVRKFVFVDEERSYAERTGQANGDMGWIRVLAFREQGDRAQITPPWGSGGWSGYRGGPSGPSSGQSAPYAGEEKSQAAPPSLDGARKDAAPQTNAQGYADGRESNPGTGWGAPQRDPVRQVRFLAERTATDQLVLRYEYASGLQALGIYPVRFRDRLWERENGQLGFAKAPRW